MGDYTVRMENALYDSWEFEQLNDDCAALLAFLNSSDFQSFGEGLTALIQSKFPESELTPLEILKEQCAANRIPLDRIATRNTLKSWFSGGPRPKKGEDSRQHMFALAFALELSIEETTRLFHNIYLDRAFNQRNYRELIYWYCLRNGKTLSHADEMIARVSFEANPVPDRTVGTVMIAQSAASMLEDETLLSYINSHPHNFALSSHTAKEVCADYLKKAKDAAKNEYALLDGFTKESYAGLDLSSVNFMYELITGCRVSGAGGTKTIFRNAKLPREIKSCFPQPTVFSLADPSFEELRKMIIFLFSYCFWWEAALSELTDILDDYIEQMDHLLFECGLPPLYFGNPYDWLFLHCTNCDSPLDEFRDIMTVLNTQE